MKENKLVRIIAGFMIIIMSLVMVFHLLVLIGVIPYNVVWGGRLSSAAQMRVFELVSILTNAFMLIIVAIRGKYLQWKVKAIFVKLALFLMAALFLLNTLGNFMSNNAFEKAFFTPQTLVLGVLCLILAISKSKQE